MKQRENNVSIIREKIENINFIPNKKRIFVNVKKGENLSESMIREYLLSEGVDLGETVAVSTDTSPVFIFKIGDGISIKDPQPKKKPAPVKPAPVPRRKASTKSPRTRKPRAKKTPTNNS